MILLDSTETLHPAWRWTWRGVDRTKDRYAEYCPNQDCGRIMALTVSGATFCPFCSPGMEPCAECGVPAWRCECESH